MDNEQLNTENLSPEFTGDVDDLYEEAESDEFEDYFEDTAFSGGIEPGGLRTTSDIRILICYLLNSVNAPLSREDILDICQDKGLANYFEVLDALSGLAERNCVSVTKSENEDDFYSIEDTGRAIAETLDVAIPLSVREKAVEAATAMLAKAKLEKENSVEITRIDEGYNVTCHISDGKIDLMKFTIYVPDIYQARKVKVNFLRNPGRTYQLLLASVTRSLDLERGFNS